jgi:hypothetical protein
MPAGTEPVLGLHRGIFYGLLIVAPFWVALWAVTR